MSRLDPTKRADRDATFEGMRDAEKRVDPTTAVEVANASGAAGWHPSRAARFSWWLETITREQAHAMVDAYFDREDLK